MPSHAAHPLIETNGLADGCLRCLDISEAPFDSLDDDNLEQLIVRTQQWMNDEPGSVARSKAEQRAMSIVEKALTYRRILNRIELRAEIGATH